MLTHSGATTSNKYFGGDWLVGCSVCHDQHTQPVTKVVGANGGFIRDRFDLRRIEIAGATDVKSGNKLVKLFNLVGPNDFADGDLVIDGVCEVCHTETTYHKNDGTGAAHNVGQQCTSCHQHSTGFKGGGF